MVSDADTKAIEATPNSDTLEETAAPLTAFIQDILSQGIDLPTGNYLPLETQCLLSSQPVEKPLALNSLNPVEVFITIANYCQKSPIGKKLPTALYIHISALDALDPILQLYERHASHYLDSKKDINLIKFHTNKPKISYLSYPTFDRDPHPALQRSIQVNLKTGQVRLTDYSNSQNPPVLHRKETFVVANYPGYQAFSYLTRCEEELGLLDNTRSIGTRQRWLQFLLEQGVEIEGHAISCKLRMARETASLPTPRIERHKAAIIRHSLSKPVRLALEADLLPESATFLDYGCGYGGDVQRLREKGYVATGWDPYYQPDALLNPADIVNLGYVINVIESQSERREALIKAWELTQKVLIVAAQVLIADRNSVQIAYEDGIITSRNTFQKYYEQGELKNYIDQVLLVDAVPVALGIYFVFRDEEEAQIFRASRFHRHLSTPRICAQVKRFEDYQEMLAPLMAFVSDRGRLPVKGELLEEEMIKAEFRSFHRAFQVILQATDDREWEAIADKRRQDLLVYLALNNLSGEVSPQKLPVQIKNDIKGLFGSYQKSYTLASLMLYSLGNSHVIADCFENSTIGRKSSGSLMVHTCYLDDLDPLLRLYEGCANRTIGRLDGATLIKFSSKKPRISYLFYPDFDTDPHPSLHTAMHIHLGDLSVNYEDYYNSPNPPVLHRKETYVTPSYPLYEKFAQLSYQEEQLGLLDDNRLMRNRLEWMKCLKEHCVKIKDHRLYWRTDANPARVKRLQAQVRDRHRKKQAEIQENQSKSEETEIEER